MIEMYEEVDFLEALLGELDPNVQRKLIRTRRRALLNQINEYESEMDKLYSEMEEPAHA
jgi:hypothetical protein